MGPRRNRNRDGSRWLAATFRTTAALGLPVPMTRFGLKVDHWPVPDLLAVTDVHYPASGGARAAAVLSHDSRFDAVVDERVAELDEVADYQPGRFYLRELPALRAVLGDATGLSLLIVDGYVDLEPDGRRPGLGAYCHEAFGVPVIGVAKTPFQPATHALEVRRGGALRPCS